MRLPLGFKRAGFTLVELLVVIGIIALLIAILLPALSRAREAANLVKCMVTLRSMGQAAQLHALEHQGYMPLAGIQAVPLTPADLGDPGRRRYTYYCNEFSPDNQGHGTDTPAPLSASLGKYMNLSVDLNSQRQLQESLRLESVIRAFTCPSDNNPITPASSIMCSSGWRGPDEVMSYLLNADALGVSLPGRSPAGKVSMIRHPAEVFLFGDGKRGRFPEVAYDVFCGGDALEDGSLFDYWYRSGRPGSSSGCASFDYGRHRNRMNVIFVDGHSETINLPNRRSVKAGDASTDDFVRVGVSKGIFR
jgi:prepilin-type N-terminal cleavage/methylation domain-containing protein/prepilin-type processing-associated H-X9-DG protein